MVDTDLNFISFNSKFVELFQLPPTFKIGCSMRDFIRHNVENGLYGEVDVEQTVNELAHPDRHFKVRQLERTRPDGTVIQIRIIPVGSGGQVSTYSDVTDIRKTEKALREREEWFRSLLESAPDATIILDEAGVIRLVNNQTKALFGYSTGELVGENVDILVPDSVRSDHKKLREGYTGEPSVRVMGAGLELYGRRKSGEKFPVEISLSPINTSEGLQVAAAVRDITERKVVEANLLQQKSIIEATLDNVEQGILMVDANGDIIASNHHLEDLFGIAVSDHPNYEDYVVAYHRSVGSGAETIEKALQTLRASDARRWDQTFPDGRTIEITRTPLEDGGYVRTYNDITERKQAETIVRDAIENISEAFVLYGADDCMIVCNEQYKNLFPDIADAMVPGVTLEELLDLGIARNQYGGETSKKDAETVKNERMENYRNATGAGVTQQMANGRWLAVRERRTSSGGVVGIRADITELKETENELREAKEKAEQALTELSKTQEQLVQTEKMASLGKLTAGIAHEIKNPLNFVNNFSETSVELVDELGEALDPVRETFEKDIRDEVEDIVETLKGDLQKINHHGKRADQIVKSMLLHARGDAVERIPTPVNDLVDEAFNLAYHGERARDQSFQATMEQDLDEAAGQAELVPQDITRVLVNMFGNAFYAVKMQSKNTGAGDYNPEVSVTTQNTGDSIEIRVRDNGLGISQEDRQKLFDPFFTTKPAGEGTGLGLSMCLDIIVQQHGGRIDVNSELGAFTEFVITLPRHATTGNLPRPVTGASA